MHHDFLLQLINTTAACFLLNGTIYILAGNISFSQAKKVITDERNRLNADTIEADQCQKWWPIKGLIPSSLIDYINTNGGSTTPWLMSFNVDLTGYEPLRTEETLES